MIGINLRRLWWAFLHLHHLIILTVHLFHIKRSIFLIFLIRLIVVLNFYEIRAVLHDFNLGISFSLHIDFMRLDRKVLFLLFIVLSLNLFLNFLHISLILRCHLHFLASFLFFLFFLFLLRRSASRLSSSWLGGGWSLTSRSSSLPLCRWFSRTFLGRVLLFAASGRTLGTRRFCCFWSSLRRRALIRCSATLSWI